MRRAAEELAGIELMPVLDIDAQVRSVHDLMHVNIGSAGNLRNASFDVVSDIVVFRIAPRHLFDLGLGVDNLFHSEKAKMRVRFSVINLTNKEALYNFQSTFSGTHFVAPRTYTGAIGFVF